MAVKKRIAIVGPESSGKTALCNALSQEKGSIIAREMSREFLEARNGDYLEADLLSIAKLQLEEEARQWKQTEKNLYCDTNLLVILIWAKWKYKRIDPELLKLWNPSSYDLHLLCYPDLPYEDDPLRENPDPEDRIALFELYRNELLKQNIPFEVIDEHKEKRIKKARLAMDSHFDS